MAQEGYNNNQDRGALNRGPYLDGNNYLHWKIKMKTFITSLGCDVWDCVENEFVAPMEPATEAGTSKALDFAKWTTDQKAKKTMEAKAMYALQVSISPSEFNRVSSCKTAKQIWDTLQMAHEGTQQIRDLRLDQLKTEYELFKMIPGETIYNLSTRFQNLCSAMDNLGLTQGDEEMVRKLLSVLPSQWVAIKTTIKQKEKKPTYTQLVSSLTAFEHELGVYNLEEGNSREKKSIALVSQLLKEDDETLALFSRKLNKHWKNNPRKYKHQGESSNSSKFKSYNDVVCFECDKPGHVKSECPRLERKKRFEKNESKEKKNGKKYHRKAFKATSTWSDEDEQTSSDSSESSSDDEVANLCLMAHSNDEVNSCNSSDSSDDECDYDELLGCFYELRDHYKNATKKNADLNKEIKFLKNDLSKLEDDNKRLIDELKKLEIAYGKIKEQKCELCVNASQEISSLNDKIKSLDSTLAKYVQSNHNHYQCLSDQKNCGDYRGLGFKSSTSMNKGKTVFVKSKSSNDHASSSRVSKKSSYAKPIYKCSFCNKLGHLYHFCYKRRRLGNTRQIWVPRGAYANMEGPKRSWVPHKK